MRAKIECVEGIILKETNYSESSKILNVLTKEYGLLGILSKGCRNMKSKLRSSSRKLIYAKFNIYYKKDGLSTLISTDIINSYKNIVSNLDKISYATYIIDLTYQVIRQSDKKEIFDILRSSLEKIDEGLDEAVITSIVELKYLHYLGVMPNIDECSICGNKTNIITLSGKVGGLICSNCYNDEYLVKDITIKLIRMFYYVDIDKITKLQVKKDNLKEINRFLQEYYDEYTGLYLKSKKILEKIKNLVES